MLRWDSKSILMLRFHLNRSTQANVNFKLSGVLEKLVETVAEILQWSLHAFPNVTKALKSERMHKLTECILLVSDMAPRRKTSHENRSGTEVHSATAFELVLRHQATSENKKNHQVSRRVGREGGGDLSEWWKEQQQKLVIPVAVPSRQRLAFSLEKERWIEQQWSKNTKSIAEHGAHTPLITRHHKWDVEGMQKRCRYSQPP